MIGVETYRIYRPIFKIRLVNGPIVELQVNINKKMDPLHLDNSLQIAAGRFQYLGIRIRVSFYRIMRSKRY